MLCLEPLFNTDTQADTDFFTYRSFFHDEETQRLFVTVHGCWIYLVTHVGAGPCACPDAGINHPSRATTGGCPYALTTNEVRLAWHEREKAC